MLTGRGDAPAPGSAQWAAHRRGPHTRADTTHSGGRVKPPCTQGSWNADDEVKMKNTLCFKQSTCEERLLLISYVHSPKYLNLSPKWISKTCETLMAHGIDILNSRKRPSKAKVIFRADCLKSLGNRPIYDTNLFKMTLWL